MLFRLYTLFVFFISRKRLTLDFQKIKNQSHEQIHKSNKEIPQNLLGGQ